MSDIKIEFCLYILCNCFFITLLLFFRLLLFLLRCRRLLAWFLFLVLFLPLLNILLCFRYTFVFSICYFNLLLSMYFCTRQVRLLL